MPEVDLNQLQTNYRRNYSCMGDWLFYLHTLNFIWIVKSPVTLYASRFSRKTRKTSDNRFDRSQSIIKRNTRKAKINVGGQVWVRLKEIAKIIILTTNNLISFVWIRSVYTKTVVVPFLLSLGEISWKCYEEFILTQDRHELINENVIN